MKGIEPVIDELNRILKAEIPGKVAEINTRFSDFELQDFETYAIEGPTSQAFPMPALFIFEEDPDIVMAVTGKIDMEYVVSIYLWHQADANGFERLNRTLWRLRNAVVEVLENHRRNPNWSNLKLTAQRTSPTTKRKDVANTFMKCKALWYGVNVMEEL